MPMYKCTFTEHLGYLVFSSTISFYLPLLVMVFTYCRIYRAAAEQTRSLKLGTKQVLMTSGEMQLTLRIHRGGTTREGHHHNTTQNTANSTPEEPDEEPLSALHNNGIRHRHLGKNFSLSRKLAKFAKEKKAAKTLGIVMGKVGSELIQLVPGASGMTLRKGRCREVIHKGPYREMIRNLR